MAADSRPARARRAVLSALDNKWLHRIEIAAFLKSSVPFVVAAALIAWGVIKTLMHHGFDVVSLVLITLGVLVIVGLIISYVKESHRMGKDKRYEPGMERAQEQETPQVASDPSADERSFGDERPGLRISQMHVAVSAPADETEHRRWLIKAGKRLDLEYDRNVVDPGFNMGIVEAGDDATISVKDSHFGVVQPQTPADPPTRSDDPHALAAKIRSLGTEVQNLGRIDNDSVDAAISLKASVERNSARQRKIESEYLARFAAQVKDVCERALANGYWRMTLDSVWAEPCPISVMIEILGYRLTLLADQVEAGRRGIDSCIDPEVPGLDPR